MCASLFVVLQKNKKSKALLQEGQLLRSEFDMVIEVNLEGELLLFCFCCFSINFLTYI